MNLNKIFGKYEITFNRGFDFNIYGFNSINEIKTYIKRYNINKYTIKKNG